MMRILSEIVVMLSASAVMSLVIKGTAVVAFGLMSAWIARRGRAAVRHALLASAFGVLLALPVVSLIAPPVTISVPVPASDSVILPLFDFNLLPPLGQNASARLGAAPAQPGLPLRSLAAMPLPTMLLCGWFVGIALFAIPVIRGLLQIRFLRRFGLPWRPGQAVAEGLAPRDWRGVEVLIHESLPGPMTCGVLRPVVMLPEDARSWDEKDLERALVHELEHVRRYDWAIHCLARVVCAAYWFHPLVWAAWRQLTLEAERSCDDAVLGNAEATAYADQLLGLARRRSTVRRSPAPAMANRSDLAARIGALLDQRQSRGPVSAFQVAACAVAVAIVLTTAPVRMVAAPQSAKNPTFEVASAPAFEVASVKPCKEDVGSGGRGGGGGGTGPSHLGRLELPCQSVRGLIRIAYIRANFRTTGEDNLQMDGGPAWIDAKQYSIAAKADGPAPIEVMEGPMLQRLLEDRFHLKTHRETREASVYALSVAKGGLKIKAAAPGSCTVRDPNDTNFVAPTDGQKPYCGEAGIAMNPYRFKFTLASGTLRQLASNLGARVDRPVLDKTGIEDKFDFHLEFAPNSADPSDEGTAPSIFNALAEIGLRLEPAKGPRHYLVIDHVEEPTGN